MKCRWKRLVAICMAGIMMSSSIGELAMSVQASTASGVSEAVELSEEQEEIITENIVTIAEEESVVTATTAEEIEIIEDELETVTEGEVVEDNYCGDTVTWTLEDGELTISGTGPMFDYTKASATPWYANASEITSVVIEDGVTTIADYGFREFTALESVVIGNDVTTIGKYAFYKCTALQSVALGSGVMDIESNAFYGDTAITELTLPNQECETSSSSFSQVNPSKIKIREDAAGVSVEFLNYTNTVAFELIDPVTEGAEGTFEVKGDVLFQTEDSARKLVRYPVGKTDVTEYTMPEDVVWMEDYAFSETSLKAVKLSENLQNISAYAFNGCTALEEITIPDSVVSIGESAFYENSSLSKAVIGNAVTTIGAKAFYKCSAMTEVVLGSNVTEIGGNAFYGNSAITELTVPNQECSDIGSNAFKNVNPTKVKIRSDATGISREFVDCSAIAAFEMIEPAGEESGNFEIKEGVLFQNKDEGKEIVRYPMAKGDLTEYQISNDVVTMSEYAFSGTVLHKVELPEGLQNIPAYAFNECAALEQVEIPNSVVCVGNYAFYKCTALKTLVLGANVTEIKNSAFSGCSAITEVTVPNQVCSNIGTNAFSKVNPEKIKIREDAQSISESFLEFTNTTAFEMEEAAEEGAVSVFEVQEAVLFVNKDGEKELVRYPMAKADLAEYTVPRDVVTVAEYAFSETALQKVELPEGLQNISAYAFNKCTALEEIGIPNSVRFVREYAFYKCEAMTSLVLGANVTEIGESAFSGCSALAELTVPNQVCSNIGTNAFSKVNPEKIKIREDAQSISEKFLEFASITAFEMEEAAEEGVAGVFEVQEAVLFANRDEGKELVRYPMVKADLAEYTVPKGVVTVAEYAFNETALQKVKLPEGLQKISAYAFNECNALEEIVIPDSVVSVGDYAFYKNPALSKVVVGEGVTAIGNRAFYQCTALADISGGSNLLTIGEYAFYMCSSLPKAVIGSKTTSIGNYAFSDCTSIEHVVIPDSVTYLGYYCFSGATGMKSLVLGEGLSGIESGVFEGCTSLENAVLGSKITYLGKSAFKGDAAIQTITVPNQNCSFHNFVFDDVAPSKIIVREDAQDVALMFLDFESVTAFEMTDPAVENAEGKLRVEDGVLYSVDGDLIRYPRGKSNETYEVLQGTKCIKEEAFDCCSNLVEVVIPDSVTTMKHAVFYNCTSLEKVVLGANVENIGTNIFYKTALKSLTLPNTGAEIDYLPNSVTTIMLHGDAKGVGVAEAVSKEAYVQEYVVLDPAEENAPINYQSVDGVLYTADGKELTAYPRGKEDTSYIVLDGTEVIGEYAFASQNYTNSLLKAPYLTEIHFPDTLREIGDNAFFCHNGLTSVSLPEGVKRVGFRAFDNCLNLSKIYIPDSVTEIGDSGVYKYPDYDLTIYCTKNSYAEKYAIAKKIPYVTSNYHISYTLNRMYSAVEGEEAQCLKEDIANYQVKLLNQTTGEVITGYTIYDNSINLPMEQVSAGDVIAITLTSKKGETLDYRAEVTLDENVSATVDMMVQEKGYIVTAPETTMETSILVFNAEGNRLETMLFENEPCISDWYEDGEYQLLYIQGPNQYWAFETLSEYAERGLIENQDYITKKVQITSGTVTRVEDVNVPEIDLKLFRYLDEKSVYMAESGAYVNGLLQVRVDYAFTELRKDEVTPETIYITIPENADYVENSMTLDGRPVSEDALHVGVTSIAVDISDNSGVLRWMFRPYNHKVLSSMAKIQFKTAERTLMETIGEIKEEIPAITLSCPSQTSDREVFVYGTAVPQARIGIYDGAVRIGTAIASKAGNWNSKVLLNEPQNGSVHKIQARICMGTSEEVTSNMVDVSYNEEHLEVTEFTLHESYTHRGKPYYKAKDLLSGKAKKNFTLWLMNTNPYLTFTIKVSDDEAVEKMYVVSSRNSGTRKLEAFYDSELDTWIASGRFGSENEWNYVPGDLSLEIVKSEKGLVKDLSYVDEVDGEELKEALADSHFTNTVNTYDENTDRGVYGGTLVFGENQEASLEFHYSKSDVEPGTYTYEELLADGFIEIETLDHTFKTLAVFEGDEKTGYTVRAIRVPNISLLRASDDDFNWGASILNNTLEETVFTIIPNSEALNVIYNYGSDWSTNDGLDKKVIEAEKKLYKEYRDGTIDKAEYDKRQAAIDRAEKSSEALRTLKVATTMVTTIAPLLVFTGPAGLAASVIMFATGVTSSTLIDYMQHWLETLINVQVKFSIDPSGYVYEGVPGNRVEGVTATVYYREIDADGSEKAVLWNAEEYDQTNPQITNEIGFYQWFVPEGYWQVKYEKEGYETAYSEWLPVPPPQTEVNIGLVSTEPPKVELVELYDDYAMVTFSKYMKADTINPDTVKILTMAGKEIPYEMEVLNGEAVDDTNLATQFKMKFKDSLVAGNYKVKVAKSVVNYADLTLESDYESVFAAKSAIRGLKAEVPKNVLINEEFTIPVTIDSDGDCSGYTLKAENTAFAEVLEISPIKENVANITVKAKLPGTAVVQVTLDGTMIQENVEFNITMTPVEEEPTEPDKPVDPPIEPPIDPPSETMDEVVRLYGSGRYETGYKVADQLKETLAVEKFEAVVVATGKNFADALAGSYLAVEKNAPILLTNGKADNVEELHAYIKANVEANGTVYILGGEGAVPAMVDKIKGYTVKRLYGSSRYDTNIEILKEAGVSGDSIIVATGKTFADSLSASAAKLPILLVKPNGSLNDVQKSFLKDMKHIYIVGGEGAVSKAYEKELAEYADVTRVFGSSRYDTSVEVAKTFCKDADLAVVASGKNFPDGLCGGPLAAALNAPLVLTKDKGTDAAAAYVAANGIKSGYVLGGAGALSDETVVSVFSLKNAEEIIEK